MHDAIYAAMAIRHMRIRHYGFTEVNTMLPREYACFRFTC